MKNIEFNIPYKDRIIDGTKDDLLKLSANIMSAIITNDGLTEPTKSPYEEAERTFLYIIRGMKLAENSMPGNIWWKDKNDNILFNQDYKTGKLYYSYYQICRKLEPFFDSNGQKVSEFVGGMAEKHLKWKGLTPIYFC